MTVNNLNDHLSWLLKTRCVVPPIDLPYPVPPSYTAASNAHTDGSDGVQAAVSQEQAAQEAFATHSNLHGQSRPRQDSTDLSPPTAEIKLSPDQTGAMARLQAASKSTLKPRLISHDGVRSLPASRSAAGVRAEPSFSEHYNAMFRKEESPPSSRPEPGTTNNFYTPRLSNKTTGFLSASKFEVEVDSLDLTGNENETSSSATLELREGGPSRIEDSASGSEHWQLNGRKRKSDSIEREAIDSTPNKKLASAQKAEILPESANFVAIDDYPEEAPPPYSVTIQRSPSTAGTFPKQTGPNDGAMTAAKEGYDEEHTLTETRIVTQTRKRKSVSRVPSNDDMHCRDAVPTCSPRKAAPLQAALNSDSQARSKMIDKPKMSQSLESTTEPSVAGRVIREVEDSDKDEDTDYIDGHGSDFGVDDFDQALPTTFEAGAVGIPPLDQPQDSPASPARRLPSSSRSNSFANEAPGTRSGTTVPSLKKSNSTASPFQRDSPTKFVENQSTQTAQKGPLAQDAKAPFNRFLRLSSLAFHKHQELLKEAYQLNQKAVSGCIDSDQPIPAHLKEQRKGLKEQIDVWAALDSTKLQYKQLMRRRDELKERIFHALDEGLEFADLQMENSKLLQDSRPLQQEAYRHLEIVLASDIPDEHLKSLLSGTNVEGLAEPQPPSDVVVQSTQGQRSHVGSSEAVSFGSKPSMSSSLNRVEQTPADLLASTPSRRVQNQGISVSRSTTARDHSNDHWNEASVPSVHSKGRSDASVSGPKTRNSTTPPANVHRQGSRSSKAHVLPRPLDDFEFDAEDLDDEHEAHEALFSTRLGKASKTVDHDADDHYGQDDDDEDMLEMADNLENHRTPIQQRYPTARAGIFAQPLANPSAKTRLRSPPTAKHGTRAFLTSSPTAMMHHPWSRDVKVGMKERFHLRGFRQNQLEAINATLSGNDAFVLMPTGGGKSLCYQLPAIVSSGKTRGVTVVISPLLSLMQDQVEHLKTLNLQAFLFNSEVTAEHRTLVMQGLRDPNVDQLVQLLYVTPEMVTKSRTLVNAFQTLHRRNRLARIVIDEAHCVSQWGHDFRPDYKALGDVRKQFPGVPVMALTATATENVKVDVIHNLNINGCEVFTQSFNRPNLTYEVRAKGKAKDILDSIADTIQTSYKGQSGIVYCLSRNDCERIAEKLRTEYNIKAHHYHAGMDPLEKNTVQKEWQAGRYLVIVATIAFGMGIDKSDVRFVFHHTIPKSLEGYYQETGRAGRDGKRSGCYLYYGYKDPTMLKRFIDEGEGSWERKERGHQMLRNMVQFCENKSDCRRVQVLAYFNESFHRDQCNNSCDNCNSDSTFETHDFTDYAASAVKLVKYLERENVTVLQCADLFRGTRSKRSYERNPSGCPEFGAGSALDRQEVERLFYRLVSEEALEELNLVNKAGFANQKIHLGRNCHEFMSGRRRLKLQVRVSPKATKKQAKLVGKKAPARGTGVAAVRADYPQSTNVSSPVQQATRRRVARRQQYDDADESGINEYVNDGFVVLDDEALLAASDDDQDGFESIREAGRPRKGKKVRLGPPITMDEKMDRLNEIHRAVVEDFVGEASREGERIRNDRGLRAQPFTDGIYREMAINFPRGKHVATTVL